MLLLATLQCEWLKSPNYMDCGTGYLWKGSRYHSNYSDFQGREEVRNASFTTWLRSSSRCQNQLCERRWCQRAESSTGTLGSCSFSESCVWSKQNRSGEVKVCLFQCCVFKFYPTIRSSINLRVNCDRSRSRNAIHILRSRRSASEGPFRASTSRRRGSLACPADSVRPLSPLQSRLSRPSTRRPIFRQSRCTLCPLMLTDRAFSRLLPM
jgi:hypothetical protein